jgi:hypothetical protein
MDSSRQTIAELPALGQIVNTRSSDSTQHFEEPPMAKPGRKVKKANHGARPACSRPRKQRRHKVKT